MKLNRVETLWINLDSAKTNRVAMQRQFKTMGFTNAKRVPARVIAPPEGYNPAFGKHFVGCAQSHIDCFEQGSLPLLILEDDAKVTAHYRNELTIPSDADAIYLGWSRANQAMRVWDYDRDLVRVAGVNTTHAILYLTAEYKDYACKVTKHCAYEVKMPLDIGFAGIQDRFKVYATRRPYFVQSEERTSENKWEAITSGVLHANCL